MIILTLVNQNHIYRKEYTLLLLKLLLWSCWPLFLKRLKSKYPLVSKRPLTYPDLGLFKNKGAIN